MPLTRSANFNLFLEIIIRIALVSAFCYMESMSPFVRVIHQSELQTEYKYPRRESYVPSGALWAIVLSVPCALSFIAWGVCNDCSDALEILLAWSLALGINGVATDTIKLIIGRPRPDFFYRCFPDGIETADLQCTGDPGEVMDGRKSFPSGHSSLSFCSLGMASVWACGRLGVMSRMRGHSARILACIIPLMMALCIAMSRSCDYHHHWQDILVGSTLGFSITVFCYRQYYNPLSSELSGVPYVTSGMSRSVKSDSSPSKDYKEIESTPLLNGRKEDKWI